MRRVSAVSILALCVTLLLGCSMNESSEGPDERAKASVANPAISPSVARAEQGLQWRMRWRDDSVVDLDSSLGTFVRAVTESHLLVLFDWDVEGEFPGVREAVPIPDILDPAPSNDPYNTADKILRIASVRPLSGDQTVVEVCDLGRASSSETSFPPYFSADFPPQGAFGRVGMVSLTIESGGTAPPGSEAGDSLFPGFNVFGDWRVLALDAGGRPGEPSPDVSICGDMGDLTAPGPSYPGWSGAGV